MVGKADIKKAVCESSSSAEPKPREPDISDAPHGPVSLLDAVLFLGIPMLAVIAHLTPQWCWPKMTSGLKAFRRIFQTRKSGEIEDRVKYYFRSQLGSISPGAVPSELAANEIQKNILLMRILFPFDGTVRTVIKGQEHIEKGLRAGKGVIVWDSHFVFANFMTKVALYRAGYQAAHLSHIRHGFSPTWLGMNLLNRIWVAGEAKYLAERVVVSYGDPKPALDRLAECLGNNSVVTFTVRDSARRPVEVPFLDHILRVAPGAPLLARKTGATLVPAFTLRQSDGSYVTTLQKPIDLSCNSSDTYSALQSAVTDYANRLEPFVRSQPGQWDDWNRI